MNFQEQLSNIFSTFSGFDVLREFVESNDLIHFIQAGIALAIGIAVVLLVFLIQRGLHLLQKKSQQKKSETIWRSFRSVTRWLIFPILCWVSVFSIKLFLVLPSEMEAALNKILIIATGFFIGKLVMHVFKNGIQILIQRQTAHKKALLALITPPLGTVIKILIWLFIGIIIAGFIGINVNGVIAGLGIGTLAIAFSLQRVLGDLFSAFIISFDKPFEIGDFVVIGSQKGVVMRVGMKTTRIKTLSGEELVMPNEQLTSAHVQNFAKMETRRVVILLQVTYDTPLEMTAQLPDMFKTIIENIENTRFDRAHLSNFADSGLEYEIVFYVLSPDYTKYMDIKQSVLLQILSDIEKRKVELAYPTRRLLIEQSQGEK